MWARRCAGRPRQIGVGLLLVLLISGWVAAVTPIDLSFAGLMDRSHPEMQRYFEASRRYGLGGRLPLLLEPEGEGARLDELESRLREALSGASDHDATGLRGRAYELGVAAAG